MPMYEYRCAACGAVSEFLVFGKQDEGLACTACGSTDLAKMLSAPNVHTAPAAGPCREAGCPTGSQCGSSPCCAAGGCCGPAF